tara:strand:- start:6037 stop:6600 length:564 start_codon:yes stop_codon:yes gene_type:complete
MAITVTEITWGDIDQAIFRDCFDKSLPYLDATPVPNILWEEMGTTKDVSDDAKFDVISNLFQNATSGTIIFKIDIDGRIVNYNYAIRESGYDGAPRMICHMMDLMRQDASGSQGWSYSAEYYQKLDAFFKSKSDDCATFSSWVIEGSGMEAAWDKSVAAGHISYTVGETEADWHGHNYKKFIITVLV